MSRELYDSWLVKYSASRDPGEALANVRKEIDALMREQPPLEVRVAALERFSLVWTEFLLSMLYVDRIPDLSPEKIAEAGVRALEFLRLAALAEAIELDKLANEGEQSE